MDAIRKWLDSSGSFEEGFELFCFYVKNKPITAYLQRRKDIDKLRYELARYISEQDKLVANIINQSTQAIAQSPESRLSNKSRSRVSRSDLPENVAVFYDEAVRTHKVIRSLHEKLKLSTSDIARARIYSDLSQEVGDNSNNWAVVDAYLTTGALPEANEDNLQGSSHSNINTARIRLSRNLKSLDKERDERKRKTILEEIKIGADYLKGVGAKFVKLKNPLKNLGIID